MKAKKSRISSSRRMMNCSCSDIKPAFEERNIPVAFSTDDNYLPYVKVALNAIVANALGRNLDVLIMHDSLPKSRQMAFLSALPRCDNLSVRFVDISKVAKATMMNLFQQKSHISVATLYRLLLPEVLKEYENILYFDVDLTFCADIGELYEIDLEGNLFGAVHDHALLDAVRNRPDYMVFAQKHGFSELDGYVNTGVMLMDLEAFRREDLFNRLLTIAVEASGYFCDQDALNFLCKGRIKTLSPRWNFLTIRSVIDQQLAALGGERLAIVHYAGGAKPWQRPEIAYANLWWRHVDPADGMTMWRTIFKAKNPVVRGSGVCVSVIVPIYNAEPYLAQLLVALAAQTLRNIEIICVDDGSTDSSRSVCEHFAEHDARFKVISQPNSGGAVARNRGIDTAKGKWLFFADADDFCKPNMLEEMEEVGRRGKLDIVVAGRTILDCLRLGYVQELNLPSAYLALGECVDCRTEGMNVFSDLGFAPWNKLYRRSFVVSKGIRFHQTPPNDDVYFVLTAFVVAARIGFAPQCYYFYRKNLATSQMGNADKNPINCIVALREVHDVVALHDVALQRQYFKASIRSCFDNLFVRRSIEGLRETYAALSTGGLKALEFPAVDPMSVDMGRYSVVYALARQKADLSEILHAYYSPRCEMLARNNSRLQKELSAFTSKVKELRQANEVKKERIVALNDQQGQLSAKVNELRAANEAKRAKLGELEAGRKQLSAKVDELRAANEAKRAKLEELEVGRKQLSAKVDELRAANEAKRAKLEELEAGRKQLSAKVDELRAANEAKRAKLGELEGGREQLSAKVDELRAANEAKRAKLGELEAGRKQLSAKVDELRAANEAKRVKLGELEAGRKQLSAKVDELRAANEAKRAKLGELEARRKQLSAKVDELRAANEAKRQRIGELQECEKRYRNVLGLVQKICDD